MLVMQEEHTRQRLRGVATPTWPMCNVAVALATPLWTHCIMFPDTQVGPLPHGATYDTNEDMHAANVGGCVWRATPRARLWICGSRSARQTDLRRAAA